MVKTQFTPGPWTVENNRDKAGDITITQAPTGGEVAILFPTLGRAEADLANANLIRTAPELYAECERTQSEIASVLNEGIQHFTPEMLQRWFKGVSETLAKARGETKAGIFAAHIGG